MQFARNTLAIVAHPFSNSRLIYDLSYPNHPTTFPFLSNLETIRILEYTRRSCVCVLETRDALCRANEKKENAEIGCLGRFVDRVKGVSVFERDEREKWISNFGKRKRKICVI